MNDELDTAIEGALREMINAPAYPPGALTERVHAAAEHRVKARRRLALLAAGVALALNATLALLLSFTVVIQAGGGWVAVMAALIGLSLATLPAVPLLAVGDIPAFMYQKTHNRLERSQCK